MSDYAAFPPTRISAPDAAAMIGCTLEDLQNLEADGRIPPSRVGRCRPDGPEVVTYASVAIDSYLTRRASGRLP